MPKPNTYHDALIKSLADPEEARHYLVAVLEHYPDGFRKALRNVAKANQMPKALETISEETPEAVPEAESKRESLYRALSEDDNPRLDSLTAMLAGLGMKLSIVAIDPESTEELDFSLPVHGIR